MYVQLSGETRAQFTIFMINSRNIVATSGSGRPTSTAAAGPTAVALELQVLVATIPQMRQDTLPHMS